MSLKINCPEGHVLTVPQQRAGQYVRCPLCNQHVRIPDLPDLKKMESAKAGKRKPKKRAESAPSDGQASPAPSKPPVRTAAAGKPAPAAQAGDLAADRLATRETTKTDQQKKNQPSAAVAQPETPNRPNRQPRAAAAESAAGNGRRSQSRPAAATSRAGKNGDQNTAVAAVLDAATEAAHNSPAAAAEVQPAIASPTLPPVPHTEFRPPLATTKDVLPMDDGPAGKSAVPKRSRTRGVEPDRSRRWIAFWLAVFLVAVGLVNLAPGAYEIWDYWRAVGSDSQQPIARWAYAALLVGGVLIAYAIYLCQLPDWSSVWAIAVVTVAVASAYAALLGIVWLGRDDSEILRLLQLDGSARRGATLWCLSMVSVMCVTAYFFGREGIRWYRTSLVQARRAA